jgi:hypothetical protein
VAADFQVRGADDLIALGKRLKNEPKALRRELTKEMRAAAKPASDAATKALADAAPGGALEDSIRKQRSAVRVSTGTRTAGVRVTAGKSGSGMRRLNNRGEVRHPVPRRDETKPVVWVTQSRPQAKGKWTQQMRARKGQLQKGFLRVMEQMNRRVAGK